LIGSLRADICREWPLAIARRKATLQFKLSKDPEFVGKLRESGVVVDT
jgi:hypothetical protein